MSDVVDLAFDDDDDEIQLTDVVIRNGSDTVNYEVKAEEDDDVQVEGFSYAMDPLDAADLDLAGGEDDVQIVKSEQEEESSIDEDDDEDMDSENTETKVFVNYLPQLWRNQHLQKMMVEFGPIVSAQVKRDPETDAPRGWGVVEFADAKDASKCVRKLRGGRTFRNKTVRADFYLEDPSKRPRKVLVKSTSPLDEQSLRDAFGRVGDVVGVFMMQNRLSAFVNMAGKESALQAVKQLDSKFINGAKVTVTFDKFSYSKAKGQFFAEYLKRQENHELYQKLKDKKIIPQSFRGAATSVKDRLGGVQKPKFKADRRNGPGTSQNCSGDRSQSVERLTRDENGKIVKVFSRSRTHSQ